MVLKSNDTIVRITMTRFFFCLTCLASAFLPLSAQDEAAEPKKTTAARSAWFACIDLPGTLENPVKVMSGQDLIDVELSKFMTSASVKIPADGILRMVRQVPDPANEGKTKFLILAQATIPENVREALIILMPVSKPEADLVFHAKVQDLAAFKGGDRLYINLSNTNIGVQLGETEIAVPAQQAKIYSSPATAQPINLPIIYRFYHPEEEKWKVFNASTIVVRPTRREIYIFNNGSRIGNIKKHSILFPVEIKAP